MKISFKRRVSSLPWAAVALGVVCSWLSVTRAADTPQAFWGAGIYMTNDAGTLLDHARWDWMVVRFNGTETDAEMIEQANWFLDVNADQKYLIRLYPSVSTPDNAHINFLHYRCDPEIRKVIQKQLRAQVRTVREKLAKPQNVLGYTLMEELPGNFGFEGLRLSSAAEIPPQVEFYRKQIEAERGQPLTWDEATWKWLGTVLEETLDELHALIKEESGGSPILFWPHLGYAAVEHAEGPVDFANRDQSIAPFSYANVLKPGRCDGIVVGLLNDTSWAQILAVAERYDAVVIAQLSHGGYMRQRSWDENLAMLENAKRESPAYRGHFFFCENQGQPSPLDKPDAAQTLRDFRDRLVQCEPVPERGKVLKVVHPASDDRPFIHKAASYLYCVDHPTHGSKGLAVKPGQTLRWSVWIKADQIQGEEGAVMTLVWDKSRGTNEQPTVLKATGTHDWKQYEGTASVPPDTVGGRVYLGMLQATGTAYFDDLRITAEGSDQLLIENGDFEEVQADPLHFKNWIIGDDSLLLAHWRVFCEQQKIGTNLLREVE